RSDSLRVCCIGFFFQAEDGIRDRNVTGVQTCALPICRGTAAAAPRRAPRPRSVGRRGRRDERRAARCGATRVPADARPRPRAARAGVHGPARVALHRGPRRRAGRGLAPAPLPRHRDDRPRGPAFPLRSAVGGLTTREREVIGLGRENDVPGALIPALYFGFLRSRRAAPLGRVFDHNRHDVLSLVALLGWFGRALAAPDHLGAEDLAGLGRLWEPVDLEQALTCYRAALGGDLPGPTAHRVRLRLARWEKRATRWDRACALWEVASRHGAFDREPWEELAKFHEHRRRDLRTARATVAHALELADAA